jgi:nitrite reductase/ring-hydroxylating ferredoxin subunit
MKANYSRKDFLKVSGKVSCSVLLSGSAISALESCSGIKALPVTSDNGKIKVPLSEFAESNIRILRVAGLEYDMMVAKKTDGMYSAVLMRCSHQDWNLTANNKGLFCGLHGSSFTLDGQVTNGPATQPLKTFKTEQNDTYLLIY